jgi:hypothetical protein
MSVDYTSTLQILNLSQGDGLKILIMIGKEFNHGDMSCPLDYSEFIDIGAWITMVG